MSAPAAAMSLRDRGWCRSIILLDGCQPRPRSGDCGGGGTQVAGWREIAVLRGDAVAPPFAPKRFDCVLASQFLHHFSEAEIVARCKLGRSWRAGRSSSAIWCAIRWHTTASSADAHEHEKYHDTDDAPLSVQRAFTLAEWRELFRRAGVGNFMSRRYCRFA